MRSRSASVLLALVAFVPLACSETPPPVTPPPPEVVAPPPDKVQPAPEPADLVGFVRWKNPQMTAGSLLSCAGAPPQIADAVTKPGLEALFKELFRGSDAKALADLVAVDAPVDGAFALEQGTRNPKGMGAFSIGLKSFDGAKAAFDASGGVIEIAPGLMKISSKNRDLVCGVAQAAGPTPARLVCGGREKDLLELGPWLARTAPLIPSVSGDLHGELRWVPFDKRFGQEVRQTLKGLPLAAQALHMEPRFDQALDDAAAALSDEVVAEASDADKIMVDLRVDPSSCLTLTGGLSFRGKASWLVKMMTDRPERQGPAPAIFWRAPKDSEQAFYSRGGDPGRFTEITHTLHALAEGALAKYGVAPADAKAVADLLNIPMAKDANSVNASGHEAGPPKSPASAKPQAVMDALASGYLGWHLVGVDAGGADIAKWFKDAAGAYNRASVHKAIASQLRPSSVKNMPIVKVGPGPAALGKGSVDVELRVNDIEAPEASPSGPAAGKSGKGPAKPAVVSFTAHILVMLDGKGAWVAVGTDRDDLVKRLVAAKTGGPDAASLASRTDLDALKSAKLLGGGYVTLAPFTKTMGTGLTTYAAATGGGLPVLTDAANALANLPHHGSTPMLVTSRVAPNGSDVEVSVNLSKGSLEDIGAMVSAGVRIASVFGKGIP